jgi:hypothetical protein
MPSRAFAHELRRSEAAELARAGDHEAAVRILDELDGDDPETLDLLARVHAQRGDLPAAKVAWQRLLSRSPEDSAAITGMRLITEITSGKRRKRPLPMRTVGATAAVVLAMTGTVVLITDAPRGPTSDASSTSLSPQPIPSSTANLGEQADAARLRGQLQALMNELAGQGVRLELQEPAIHVVFDEGLFLPNGSELSTNGQRELGLLGQRLSGKDVRVTVLGHSVVVKGGPESGGSEVALARAATAAKALARASGRPLTSFTATTAEQSASPHTDSGPGTQARNRTVSLLITLTNS